MRAAVSSKTFLGKEKPMATPGKAPLKLTEEPEVVTWPETHYVFVEKVGPFRTLRRKLGKKYIRLFHGFPNTTKSRDT